MTKSATTGRGATARPSGAVAPETVERLRLVIARLARLLRQQDDSGLGPTVIAALSTVARYGPLTLGDLAASERVAPPTITKVVDKMENAGLVERQSHPVDRRVSLVGVTPLGEARLEQLRNRRNAWLSVRLDDLDDDDLALVAAATSVLERIVDQPDPGADPSREMSP
ncbi:MAG: MarR family transcriptional regulator [Ilumatobacteraceae bacterium]